MINIRESLKFVEYNWSRLLTEIEDGKLVPVIGRELMVAEIDGKQQNLYSVLAHKLAEILGLDPDILPRSDSLTISDVAYAYRLTNRDPADVYYQLGETISQSEWPIPAPLQKLAEISGIKLFVAMTSDDLMVRALDGIRPDGAEKTIVCSFSPHTKANDLPVSQSLEAGSPPVVFKLFGDIAMAPNFVITDEDVLQCVYHLQRHDERPENLLDAVRKRSIALLGCSFDNWLNRFFFCSTKSEAVFGYVGAGGVVADQKTAGDEMLLPFLARNKTLLYDGDGIDFIDELHRRWTEKHASQPKGEVPEANSDRQVAESDLVFISYARENQEAAFRIHAALESAGIPAWIDRRLSGGQNFDDEIVERIKDCSVFIPVVSADTRDRAKGYFRSEWNEAIKQAAHWDHNHPYIQPIVIDDASATDQSFPREFRSRHWERFPGGEVTPEYVKKLSRVLARFANRRA